MWPPGIFTSEIWEGAAYPRGVCVGLSPVQGHTGKAFGPHARKNSCWGTRVHQGARTGLGQPQAMPISHPGSATLNSSLKILPLLFIAL